MDEQVYSQGIYSISWSWQVDLGHGLVQFMYMRALGIRCAFVWYSHRDSAGLSMRHDTSVNKKELKALRLSPVDGLRNPTHTGVCVGREPPYQAEF
jgi:hypothetical protein